MFGEIIFVFPLFFLVEDRVLILSILFTQGWEKSDPERAFDFSQSFPTSGIRALAQKLYSCVI